MSEGLEERMLLTSTITGYDVDGDRWVLKLEGPGALQVTKVPDASGNPQSLDSLSSIDTITVAGANPMTTRLVGQVIRGANGDGKVFFNHLTELGGRAENTTGTNGIEAIDMPAFWLGQTLTTTGAAEPSISIPDGVINLRFGGADTTYTPPGGTPLNTNNTADAFTVNLGLPRTQGTSILIDQSITSAQAGTTTSTGTAGTPTQDSVTFTVSGRINQFQANGIQGSTAFPSSGFTGGGGTIVNAITDPLTAIIGQIGYSRVGGNATNFSVMTGDKVSDFYIGGETNNVFLLAPNGSRTIGFGKGMDTVTIQTHFITTLQANRGALNSNVTVDRNVGRITFGGDVVNTNIISGVQQSLATVYQNQAANTNAPTAQDGGALTNVLVAGNITNSLFTASVEPFNSDFSDPQALKLPHGHITAKVGGTIDDSGVAGFTPDQAFYAKYVNVIKGQVVPPIVPELPFRNEGAAPHGPRIVPHLQPTANPPTNLFPSGKKVAAKSVTHVTATTPKGPAKKK
jgi:hypothetical protein